MMIIFILLRAFPASFLGEFLQFTAALIIYPAIILIIYGLARLFILNILHKAALADVKSTEHIRLSVRDVSITSIAVTVPILGGVYVLHSEASPIHTAKEINPLFEQVCTNAGEKILIHREDARSIFFPKISQPFFSGRITNGFIYSSIVDWPNITILAKYDVDYVEIEHIDSNPSAGQGIYYRAYGELIGELNNKFPVKNYESDYVVYSEVITNESDRALGIIGQTMKIVDLKTDEVVATNTYFVHTKQRRFCGYAPGDIFSQSDFIARSLNLKPRSR